MTLLRTIIALVLAASTLLASNSANEAKQNLKKENFPIQIDASSKMIYAQKGEVLQSAPNFYVLDTLLNAYSYFSNEQQPFVYDSYSANLITIHRGSLASGFDSTAHGSLSKCLSNII